MLRAVRAKHSGSTLKRNECLLRDASNRFLQLADPDADLAGILSDHPGRKSNDLGSHFSRDSKKCAWEMARLVERSGPFFRAAGGEMD